VDGQAVQLELPGPEQVPQEVSQAVHVRVKLLAATLTEPKRVFVVAPWIFADGESLTSETAGVAAVVISLAIDEFAGYWPAGHPAMQVLLMSIEPIGHLVQLFAVPKQVRQLELHALHGVTVMLTLLARV